VIGFLYLMADALRRRTLAGDHGRIGEDMAHRYLRRQGCTVVARNYRPRSGAGEIDVVVRHRGNLVFVEVKTRADDAFGPPERAVDTEKRRRLMLAARDYARRTDTPWEATRFDIVSIVLAKPARIEWLRDAFR
jgi:putative endonuclease